MSDNSRGRAETRRLKRALFTILGVVLVAPSIVSAQLATSQPPASDLGQHLRAFVQAFNAGDATDIEDFVRQHYQEGTDADAETRRWLRWRSIYGPIELASVEFEEIDRLRVFARGRLTGGWIELTLRRAAASPERLRTIAVGAGLRPPAAAGGEIAARDLPDSLAAYLEGLSDADYFSGVVMVARDGRSVFERAFGWADRANQVPNTLDTRFNLGSITKVFTALAVLQLVEDGRLGLDDPAHRHIPGYPLDERITIRHLLTHTSGLGRGEFDSDVFAMFPRTVDEWLPLTIAPLDFEPGTDVRYSNGAWIILGSIIERISGVSFDEYLRENVYAPAGMSSSGAFELDRPPPGIALGYTHGRALADGRAILFEPGPRRTSQFMNGVKGNPAGLSLATGPDLIRFRDALLDHRLLGPEMTATFLSPQVAVPGEPGSAVQMSYGFAWEIAETRNSRRIGKDGGSWGVSARFAWYPDEGYTLIVLSNYDSIGIVVADHIGELLEAAR